MARPRSTKTNGSPAGRAAGAGPVAFVTRRPAGKQNGATSSVRSSAWRGKAQSARGMTTPGSVGWMASDGGRRCFLVAPARRRTAAAQRCATVRFGARRVSRVSVVAIVSSCAASQASGIPISTTRSMSGASTRGGRALPAWAWSARKASVEAPFISRGAAAAATAFMGSARRAS